MEMVEATVLAIIKDGRLVDEARKGDEVEVVTDRTPFFGERGGQCGDRGLIVGLKKKGQG